MIPLEDMGGDPPEAGGHSLTLKPRSRIFERIFEVYNFWTVTRAADVFRTWGCLLTCNF